MNREKISDSQIVRALKASMGKVYQAAEKLDCHADTIYKRGKTSRAVARAIHHYRGKMLDIAENVLANSVAMGEPWAVKFTLTTVGRHRGYGSQPLPPEPEPELPAAPGRWKHWTDIPDELKVHVKNVARAMLEDSDPGFHQELIARLPRQPALARIEMVTDNSQETAAAPKVTGDEDQSLPRDEEHRGEHPDGNT